MFPNSWPSDHGTDGILAIIERLQAEEAARDGGPSMTIGPRVEILNSRTNHIWTRTVYGVRFKFNHVKVTRLARPYMVVTHADTGAIVRCTCPRTDCP